MHAHREPTAQIVLVRACASSCYGKLLASASHRSGMQQTGQHQAHAGGLALVRTCNYISLHILAHMVVHSRKQNHEHNACATEGTAVRRWHVVIQKTTDQSTAAHTLTCFRLPQQRSRETTVRSAEARKWPASSNLSKTPTSAATRRASPRLS